MSARSKLKSAVARRFFRTMLNARSIRAKDVQMPFQILSDDILTGHMGDPMLQELYQLKRFKGHKWRD